MRRLFPAELLDRIAQLMADSEKSHGAELRLCIEGSLPFRSLITGSEPRERALQIFSEYRVWDTEQNNGVLIYLLVADHDFEIVADRGLNTKVDPAVWEQICQEMGDSFHRGAFEEGLKSGVLKITKLLAEHFPPRGEDKNELPNRPIVL